MIILNSIYEVLKGRLKAISSVKQVDWFNGQYNNMDDEKATKYPAVYVEFLDPINWVQSGNKFQHASVGIRLHCVLFDLLDSPLRTLTFSQAIYENINSKSLYDTNDFQLTTEMVRTATTFPKRYNQLKVVKMDFNCEVFDVTGMPIVEEVTNLGFIINP